MRAPDRAPTEIESSVLGQCGPESPVPETVPTDQLPRAARELAEFLGAAPLTARIADLERRLQGSDRTGVEAAFVDAGLRTGVLEAALVVRRDFGRLNDLIHALAILLALPRLLVEGEVVVNRPSLAAGNDPSRPYDLETSRRVAEFKLSKWTGRDAMRKRETFKDFVRLAADDSGRQAELFVVGTAPSRFLKGSRSTAEWALDRAPSTRRLFAARFGRLSTSVAEFTAGPGARVLIRDLSRILPEVTLVSDVTNAGE